jgi:hypothetical protein
LRIAIVLGDQLALLDRKPLQTTVEALQALLVQGMILRRLRQSFAQPRWRIEVPRVVDAHAYAFPTDVLEQNESRNDVAIARRRGDTNDATLFEGAGDAVERLVGEFISR